MIHNSEKIIFSLNPLLGYMSLDSNCPGSSKKAASLILQVPVHSSSHQWEADTTLLGLSADFTQAQDTLQSI